MISVRTRIGILGGRIVTQEMYGWAEEIGEQIASRGGIVICGGMSGIMEAVCKGVQKADGISVGILPTDTADEGNRYISIPVVTGMGTARNSIIVKSSEGVIAIDGKYGTLTEIGYALSMNKPVVGLHTWDIPGVIRVNSPTEAVDHIFELIKNTHE